MPTLGVVSSLPYNLPLPFTRSLGPRQWELPAWLRQVPCMVAQVEGLHAGLHCLRGLTPACLVSKALDQHAVNS